MAHDLAMCITASRSVTKSLVSVAPVLSVQLPRTVSLMTVRVPRFLLVPVLGARLGHGRGFGGVVCRLHWRRSALQLRPDTGQGARE
jgi:hypothetical protein